MRLKGGGTPMALFEKWVNFKYLQYCPKSALKNFIFLANRLRSTRVLNDAAIKHSG
jgi:hypothetical protein